MKELLRSNDLVMLSWIKAVLNEANIETFVLDEQMSVLEGSAAAIPRRVMVKEEDHAEARKALKNSQSDIDKLILFEE